MLAPMDALPGPLLVTCVGVAGVGFYPERVCPLGSLQSDTEVTYVNPRFLVD